MISFKYHAVEQSLLTEEESHLPSKVALIGVYHVRDSDCHHNPNDCLRSRCNCDSLSADLRSGYLAEDHIAYRAD